MPRVRRFQKSVCPRRGSHGLYPFGAARSAAPIKGSWPGLLSYVVSDRRRFYRFVVMILVLFAAVVATLLTLRAVGVDFSHVTDLVRRTAE